MLDIMSAWSEINLNLQLPASVTFVMYYKQEKNCFLPADIIMKRELQGKFVGHVGSWLAMPFAWLACTQAPAMAWKVFNVA